MHRAKLFAFHDDGADLTQVFVHGYEGIRDADDVRQLAGQIGAARPAGACYLLCWGGWLHLPEEELPDVEGVRKSATVETAPDVTEEPAVEKQTPVVREKPAPREWKPLPELPAPLPERPQVDETTLEAIRAAEALIDTIGVELELMTALGGELPGSPREFGTHGGCEALLAALEARGGFDASSLKTGDTDRDGRAWARKHASFVLTNPDMLHIGILPNHRRWSRFFSNLEYVVVDEMHSFKGIFGTHVALILRRLRRIAAHYGAKPTFVLTSATIGNPEQLGSALVGDDVRVLEGDDSPAGRRLVALWNPELVDAELGNRRSSIAESSDLFRDLVNADAHTILFARSRRGTELVYRWARDGLPKERAGRIAPYRSGYLASERREIEERLEKACAGVNELAVATRDDKRLGVLKKRRLALQVNDCWEAASAAEEILP